MLVLVCGLPATGKSTIARNIAKKLRAAHLNTDAIRKRLIDSPKYTKEEKTLVYRVMLLVAEYLLRSDRNVVIDGTFYRAKPFRGPVYDISERTGARLAVVECRAPDESIKRRMGRRARRKNQLSDADYKIYKKIKIDFEPIKRDHLVLDTSKSKQNNMEDVLRYLDSQRMA